MSVTESATKIGDTTPQIGGELRTEIMRLVSASGNRLHVLERPGARPGDMAIAASRGRTRNRGTLINVVVSARAKTSDSVAAAKDRFKVEGVVGVEAPLTDQAVEVSNGGRVNAACPAGAQASEVEGVGTAGAVDVGVVGAEVVGVVEDNE
jgi:hypothetical protein